jgi:transcriptional regulator with XRE-family HTH domain
MLNMKTTGRPAKSERTAFGARLHGYRVAAGLSQQELAEKLGLSQRAYAYWERHPVALRPEQLQQLAAGLKISVGELLDAPGEPKRGNGPTGKMQRLFEEVSQLPRRQQEKVAEFVGAFVRQHQQSQQ